MKKISETSSYKWWVLFTLQCVVLLLGIDATIVNLALPTITKDLQINIGAAQWIISIFLITSAISMPIIGKLSDMFGRKQFFIGGLVIIAATSLVCAFSKSLELLLIMRFFQGFGYAACLSNSNPIVSTIFPPNRQGFALGLNATIYSVGFGIGVLGGGYLIENFSWHSIFFINSILGILFALVSFVILIEEKISVKYENARSFDFIGTLVFILMTSLLMTGLINISKDDNYEYISFFLVLSGFIFVPIFIYIERRSPHPLLDLGLYKIHAFVNGTIVRMLYNFINYSVLFVIPFFAQYTLNFSPSISGVILTPYTIALLLMGPIGGHFADKFGGRVMVFLGFIISASTILYLIFLSEMDQQKVSIIIKLMIGLFLYGFGMGMINGPNNKTIYFAIHHSKKGVVSGLLFASAFISGAISTAISAGIIHKKVVLINQLPIAIAQAKLIIFCILLAAAIVGVIINYPQTTKKLKDPQ